MGKSLYIAEKPSVALEFARVLNIKGARKDGYVESEDSIVTWCVGHLVTMCYPESYDPGLKKWSTETLPFIPDEWKYRVIDGVKKQFDIVSSLLNREDVENIYVCTDSGREGEYIYRLVSQEAGVSGKNELRVWIDSQTEEEIKRGIREAKPIQDYDALSDAAYLRAKEDYLMGINFSRILTLKYGPVVASTLRERYAVISVGRVMTCVLGMVVEREREIRSFVKTPFYRFFANFGVGEESFQGEWKVQEKSAYFNHPNLYRENGFKDKETAEGLKTYLEKEPPVAGQVTLISKKSENKNPPLLFNLAELQNECSKRFKITPDETLNITQELYEKKLVTYPRTDARVLSSAIAKEIHKNLQGLSRLEIFREFTSDILQFGSHQKIGKSRYTDDKKITDHYAIIPTGQGLNSLSSLSPVKKGVYELICKRFLAIFYPAAKYEKYTIQIERMQELFSANCKALKEEGFLKLYRGEKKEEEESGNLDFQKIMSGLKKGDILPIKSFEIREGETTPPKRYTTGSLILAMENAGKLIEDESLREEIKGSGIGTSATRAEILKKLENNCYLKVNKKTQVVSPELLGELIYDVVECSIHHLLNPALTASWEKGLSQVAEGQITKEEYMEKLTGFVERRTNAVKGIGNPGGIRKRFLDILPYYQK